MEVPIWRLAILVPVFLPSTIDVEASTLVRHRVILPSQISRHDNVSVHFTSHFEQLFIQACIHWIHMQSA